MHSRQNFSRRHSALRARADGVPGLTADATNLPGPMYAWHLRNMYLENKLCVPGELTMCGGVRIPDSPCCSNGLRGPSKPQLGHLFVAGRVHPGREAWQLVRLGLQQLQPDTEHRQNDCGQSQRYWKLLSSERAGPFSRQLRSPYKAHFGMKRCGTWQLLNVGELIARMPSKIFLPPSASTDHPVTRLDRSGLGRNNRGGRAPRLHA